MSVATFDKRNHLKGKKKGSKFILNFKLFDKKKKFYVKKEGILNFKYFIDIEFINKML